MKTNWNEKIDPVKDLKETLYDIKTATGLFNSTQIKLNNWFLNCKIKYFNNKPIFKCHRILGQYTKYECIINNKIISEFKL